MYPKKLKQQVICNIDEPVVETRAGKLRGLITDGTYIFRGIRYAEAKRFHMPAPVTPWEGVRNAIRFGNVCPEMATNIPLDEDYVPHFFYPQDENCQYLNVWTQGTDPSRKRPVLFWIHGGGYMSGSSIEIFSYDGENLSQYGDVVVVSINHRLNVLGFLDLSLYGEQYKYSGNSSLADIVAALEWVRDNIANFGGDPDNVTIMGQSGGGFKVSNMLQVPAADGLFHRGVIQSGMMEDSSVNDQKDARALAARVLELLEIAPADVEQIESVPYYKLRRAAQQATEELGTDGILAGWSPVFDDDYYKGNPLGEVGFRAETKHIPILNGTNLGEFAGNANYNPGEGAKNNWSDAYKEELFRKQFGAQADAVMEAFKKAYPDKNTADALMMDTIFRKGAYAYAKKRAASGCAPIYNYMFNLEMPYLDGSLAWHNAEEAYMFHNALHIPTSYIPGVTEELQDKMATAWLSFAAHGDPNHEGLPHWEPVAGDRDATMIFDRTCGMVYDHDRELLDVYPTPTELIAGAKEPANKIGGGPRQSL